MTCFMTLVRTIGSRLACAALILTALAGGSVAQQPDAGRAIAAENRALAAEIDQAATTFGRTSAELDALLKAKGDLEERLERIQRRAQVHAIGQELARTRVRELH